MTVDEHNPLLKTIIYGAVIAFAWFVEFVFRIGRRRGK